MKQHTRSFLSLLLAFCCLWACSPAKAAQDSSVYTAPGGLMLRVPWDWTVVTRDMAADDPAFAKYGTAKEGLFSYDSNILAGRKGDVHFFLQYSNDGVGPLSPEEFRLFAQEEGEFVEGGAFPYLFMEEMDDLGYEHQLSCTAICGTYVYIFTLIKFAEITDGERADFLSIWDTRHLAEQPDAAQVAPLEKATAYHFAQGPTAIEMPKGWMMLDESVPEEAFYVHGFVKSRVFSKEKGRLIAIKSYDMYMSFTLDPNEVFTKNFNECTVEQLEQYANGVSSKMENVTDMSISILRDRQDFPYTLSSFVENGDTYWYIYTTAALDTTAMLALSSYGAPATQEELMDFTAAWRSLSIGGGSAQAAADQEQAGNGSQPLAIAAPADNMQTPVQAATQANQQRGNFYSFVLLGLMALAFFVIYLKTRGGGDEVQPQTTIPGNPAPAEPVGAAPLAAPDHMFCAYCGKAILSDSRFCKYCGKEQ